jgi:AcrR family transcriptional regulator
MRRRAQRLARMGNGSAAPVGPLPLVVIDRQSKSTDPHIESATPGSRDAYLVAAEQVIAERGLESLSLREVARKLGVSHQAPYKHYPSRDHLLAEVMRRCFQRFAAHLDAREHFDAPEDDLASLGRQYLSYAQQHPLEYRLMFSTPWPDTATDPDLVRDAVRTFDILRQVLRRMHDAMESTADRVDLDALFVWSSMHGLAGVINGDVIGRLELDSGLLNRTTAHVMGLVGRALGA